jgi:DNA-binding protein H-NS
MNILEKANEIVNLRKEEKERQYGPFEEGMERAAKIASIISNKEITNDDIYICMIALKLSRQSFKKKCDNLLDLVAYIGAWQNKINKDLEK